MVFCKVKNHILCILGLRMKREEIKQLKAQLLDRDKVIQKMREQEAAYLAQADSFKVGWLVNVFYLFYFVEET